MLPNAEGLARDFSVHKKAARIVARVDSPQARSRCTSTKTPNHTGSGFFVRSKKKELRFWTICFEDCEDFQNDQATEDSGRVARDHNFVI
jgi:hypothetical protein